MICPKLVIPMWKNILDKFGITPILIINYEKLCRGNLKWLKYPDVEDRYLNTTLLFPKGSFIILDEAHKCKGVTSLQSGLMIALKRQGYMTLYLSATQATSPLDMRAFSFATNLTPNVEMKTYKTFCIDAGAEWKGHHGAMYFDFENLIAQEKMKQCHNNLFNFQRIASRLTHEDMRGLFPENQIVAEPYDMGSESDNIRGIYDEMELELERLQERCENYSHHILAVITAARRKVEMCKVPSIVEMTEELFDEKNSVVIFVNYTDTIEALTKRLKKTYDGLIGYIYGEQSMKNRIQDVEDFQNDVKRIIIANIAAGGQSVSLHDLNGKYPRKSIINPSYSAINVLQSAGRIFRQGGRTPCYQRFLYAARTIEESICKKFQTKKDNIDLLNNGDLIGDKYWFRYVGGRTI